MFRVSWSDAIGVAGIVFGIVLIVLDKAGKLKGNWLVFLLLVAAAMTMFIALGNPWVVEAPAKWKLWRGAFMFCLVVLAYSGVVLWITPTTEEKQQEVPTLVVTAPPRQTTKRNKSSKPPIITSDGFTALIPFDTANLSFPIPLDENQADPHARFYRDLHYSFAEQPVAGYLMERRPELSVEENRPIFLARLLQMYVFDLAFFISRPGYGVELSGGKVSPVNQRAVIPPNWSSTSPDYVIADLSTLHIITPRVAMSLKNFPLHLPNGGNVSFTEKVDSKSGKAFAYITRIERPGFFRFDLIVQPMGNSNEGVLPGNFQTQVANTVKTYDLIIAMESVVQIKDDDGFEPDKYAAWTRDTFSEIRSRMTY